MAIPAMPGDDHVEVGLVAAEDRAEQREEQERQEEVEERRRRVAPEHPALEPVLAPGEGRGLSHRRSPPRPRRPSRRPRDRLGRQLEVDVLERRAGDGEVAQPVAARERRARELVQQGGRVVGLARLERAVLVAPRHAVARRAGPERGGRPLGDEPPLLDDRDAVAERLRLVEVVRREEDRLAEVLQRADDVPRRAPRRRVEAGRRLVEEDQLGVADEREREVQAAQLAAAQRARVARRPSRSARRGRRPRRRRAARG